MSFSSLGLPLETVLLNVRGNPPVALPALHATAPSRLGWSHESTIELPGRAASFADPTSLPALSTPSNRLVATAGPLFCHQGRALALHSSGSNVVISTGTGSGKTRVFHLAAVETLSRDPRALTLALYPGKALAREQAGKWEQALLTAGLNRPGDGSVTLLTGDQSDKARRLKGFSGAKVAVMTPDVLHAWCLSHLSDRTLQRALNHLSRRIIPRPSEVARSLRGHATLRDIGSAVELRSRNVFPFPLLSEAEFKAKRSASSRARRARLQAAARTRPETVLSPA